jgi:hypothetical protein
MLSLLRKLWHDFVHVISDVEKWILKLIHAVYSFVNRLFHELARAVNDVWKSLVAFSRAVRKYVHQVYVFALWIVQHAIPDVIHWALRNMDIILRYAEGIARWAAGWIARIYNDLAHAISDLERWVISNVWGPLFDAIGQAWDWITHEGFYAWNLITHPELLIKVLAAYLWSSWLGLIKRNSPQIARWLIHAMIAEESRFADVLESIISNLL